MGEVPLYRVPRAPKGHGFIGPDDVLQETSARYRAVEPSSGSNVFPRRARPGLTGLRPHARQASSASRATTTESGDYMGASLMTNSPPPQDNHRTLGTILLQGLRRGVFLMSEVPLWREKIQERLAQPRPTVATPHGRAPCTPRECASVLQEYRGYLKLRTRTGTRVVPCS